VKEHEDSNSNVFRGSVFEGKIGGNKHVELDMHLPKAAAASC
jgi:hypothetical protein